MCLDKTMREKIIDAILRSGTSTILACIFCYYTFNFFNAELARVHKKNEDILHRSELERKRLTKYFVDCLKGK